MSDLISRQAAIDAFYLYPNINWTTLDVLKKINEMPTIQPEIIRCKDCKHFEYNHIENVNGIPLIVAHEICTRWADGVKTSENGYCFLAERREVTT